MLSLVGSLQGQGVIVNGTVLTNPSDQTILADSSPILAGNYLLAVTGACSVALIYDLQIRDSTNSTTLFSMRRRPAAGNEDFLIGFKIPVGNQQRVRAVLVGAIVGEVQLSIIYGEVG